MPRHLLKPVLRRMWLLNTSTAEQKFFADPNDVPGGYAIISHVWDDEKDNFQSVAGAVKKAKYKAEAEASAKKVSRSGRRRNRFQALRKAMAEVLTDTANHVLHRNSAPSSKSDPPLSFSDRAFDGGSPPLVPETLMNVPSTSTLGSRETTVTFIHTRMVELLLTLPK